MITRLQAAGCVKLVLSKARGPVCSVIEGCSMQWVRAVHQGHLQDDLDCPLFTGLGLGA